MLSIYDVVFEKVNFRSAFSNIEKKVKPAKGIVLPIESNDLSCYSTLPLRTAIRLNYLFRGNQEAAYGDLFINATMAGEQGQASELILQLQSDNRIEMIVAMAKLIYAFHSDYGSYLFEKAEIGSDRLVLCDQERLCAIVEDKLAAIVLFEKRYGRIPLNECEFTGAYNDVITSSFCLAPVYHINNTLWIFESTYRGYKWWISTVLIAFVMSAHSTYKEYASIDRLACYNTRSGDISFLQISDLSNATFSSIARNYIGYKLNSKRRDWRTYTGTNPDRLCSAIHYHQVGLNIQIKPFDPKAISNGIHEISYDEYWTYYERYVDQFAIMPTKPSTINRIYLLKDDPYLMFLASGKKGYYLCQGGKFTCLEHNIDYYYTNLKRFGIILESIS